MKRYIVAAAAGLVLLVIAVTILLAKFPVSLKVVTINLPPAPPVTAEASASVSASSVPVQVSADELGLGTPEAFLAAIYKHYESNPMDVLFSTLEHPSDYYDPGLVVLMEENSRLYVGDQGAIDSDPICQCQDWASIKTKIRIVKQDATSAKAVATLVEANGGKPYTVTLQLVRIDGRWRIHDIACEEYRSLRVIYRDSNEDGRKYQASSSSS